LSRMNGKPGKLGRQLSVQASLILVCGS